MPRFILLSFVFCLSSLSSHAFLQGNKLKKLEMEIVALLKDFSDFDEVYKRREKAKEKLVELVRLDSNYQYPMDSLKEYTSFKVSEDKKVRTISFDLVTGGTWHDYACIAQFKGGFLDLNSIHCGEKGCYTDAAVFKIEQINFKESNYYLTYAYGTHGAGHHHKVARVYFFEKGKLKLHETFMNGKAVLPLVSARRHRPQFEFDLESDTLRHPEFKPGPNSGFLEPTGKILFYKLTEKGFKLQ